MKSPSCDGFAVLRPKDADPLLWSLVGMLPDMLREMGDESVDARFSSLISDVMSISHPCSEPDERSVATASGLRIYLDIGDPFACHIYYGFLKEKDDLDILIEVAREARMVIDVGANFGLYALMLAEAGGQECRVLAYEPIDAEVARLNKSAADNRLEDRITTSRQCISDQTGELQFHVAKAPSFSSAFPTNRSKTAETITVPCSTLDVISAEIPGPVDILKIDVEGAEPLVLRGAAQMIEGSPDIVILAELNTKNYGSVTCDDYREILEKLENQGFQIWTRKGISELPVPTATRDIPFDRYYGNIFIARRDGKGAERLAAAIAKITRPSWGNARVEAKTSATEPAGETSKTLGMETNATLPAAQNRKIGRLTKQLALVSSERDRAVSQAMALEEGMGILAENITQLRDNRDAMTAANVALTKELAETREARDAHKRMNEQRALGKTPEIESPKQEISELEARLNDARDREARLKRELDELRTAMAIAPRLAVLLRKLKTVAINLFSRAAASKHGLALPNRAPTPDALVKWAPWPWLRERYHFTTLLDIGANDGDFGAFLCGYFGIQKTILFEPIPENVARLQSRAMDFPGMILHDAALSDWEGETTFNISEDNASSSFHPPTENYMERFPGTRVSESITVPVRRLDDMIDIDSIDGDLLVKIDVEGHEVQVFAGGEKVFRRAQAVYLEISYAVRYSGGALFNESHQALTNLGFTLAGICNQISPPDEQVPLFGHALYIRQ